MLLTIDVSEFSADEIEDIKAHVRGRTEKHDTYLSPKDGWVCFHCGERFRSPGLAGLHFGIKPDAVPGCMLKVEKGEESGLLYRFRQIEDENRTLRTNSVNVLARAVKAEEALKRATGSVYTGFGKRSDQPCEDCNTDGICTMNCGPVCATE